MMKCITSFALLFSVVLSNAQHKPFVLGEIAELNSTQLNEHRILNIYLPDGYTPNDTTQYPVIYALDGSANEDFVHICGLVQFFNMMGMMPPAVVVGIANVDRKRDFTFPTRIEQDKKDFPTTGGSEKFIAFIEKEVQPYIEKNYRTNHSKTIIGQSLGGLLASEILLKNPNLFNQYIIVSPSLWWNKESLLEYLSGSFKTNPLTQLTTIYVAVGKEGRTMEKDAKRLVQALKRHKLAQVHFQYLPDEDHATILHSAVYKAFRILYKMK